MGRDFDINALVHNLTNYRARGNAADSVAVMKAIHYLRMSSLPESYVDGVQDELLRMICSRVARDYVYLAFHGEGKVASHMKIGVAKNVAKRMSGISTSSPLPRLWVFSAPLIGRKASLRIEKALLEHMSEDRSNGEWVSVGGLSESAAIAVVESLAEVAALVTSQSVKFTRNTVK